MGDDGGGCSYCAAMEAQVARLQAQVSQLENQVQRLEQENRRLRQMVERLRNIVQQARAACLYYARQAMEVLGQKSGVPRPAWAYNKGMYGVARNVLAILSQGLGG